MRWVPFRPDEEAKIAALLFEWRPDLREWGWETRAAQAEMVLALAAWRSLPLADRVNALIDALDVIRDASGVRWDQGRTG